MPSTFAGLLLDIGGPVMPAPYEFHSDLERTFGLPSGAITWRGPFDPANDPLWAQHHAGRITAREYWMSWVAAVQGLTGTSLAAPEFLAACYRAVGVRAVRPEAAALVVDARSAGLEVGALTNDASWLLPRDFLDSVPVFSELDALVDLSHAGVLKPQPEAYTVALDALGLAAGRVLFVDDQPQNVAGAEAVGMHAVRFDVTDASASMKRIREVLGLRPST